MGCPLHCHCGIHSSALCPTPLRPAEISILVESAVDWKLWAVTFNKVWTSLDNCFLDNRNKRSALNSGSNRTQPLVFE